MADAAHRWASQRTPIGLRSAIVARLPDGRSQSVACAGAGTAAKPKKHGPSLWYEAGDREAASWTHAVVTPDDFNHHSESRPPVYLWSVANVSFCAKNTTDKYGVFVRISCSMIELNTQG